MILPCIAPFTIPHYFYIRRFHGQLRLSLTSGKSPRGGGGPRRPAARRGAPTRPRTGRPCSTGPPWRPRAVPAAPVAARARTAGLHDHERDAMRWTVHKPDRLSVVPRATPVHLTVDTTLEPSYGSLPGSTSNKRKCAARPRPLPHVTSTIPLNFPSEVADGRDRCLLSLLGPLLGLPEALDKLLLLCEEGRARHG